MKRVCVLLLTVLLQSSVPMGPSRLEAPLSADQLLSQPSQPKGPYRMGAQGGVQNMNAQITTLLGNLPLSFVENKGHVNDQVGYYTKTRSATAYFTGGEIVYQFLMSNDGKDKPQEKSFPADIKTSAGKIPASQAPSVREETIRVSFIGASKKVWPEAQGEQEARFNYFRGNDPQKWVSGARSHRKVVYRDLYPGINLLVSGAEGR